MQKDVSGSILLGSGILASIAYKWADIEAYSVPIYQKALVYALIIGGIVLLGLSLREEYQ